MDKRKLKQHLLQLEKGELIDELLGLYSKFSIVKNHYKTELGTAEDRAVVLDEVKQKIRLLFFPNRGIGDPKKSKLRKLILDYKKIAVFQHEYVDLLLHRVECSVEYSVRYGYIQTDFCEGLYQTFEEACQLIAYNRLEEMFEQRIQDILYNNKRLLWVLQDELLKRRAKYPPLDDAV